MSDVSETSSRRQIVINCCDNINVIFSSVLVKRAIRKREIKSKGDPDGLPPIFIKTFFDQLSTPLAYVYSQCMEFSYLPPDAYITPAFKKGDPSCPYKLPSYCTYVHYPQE